MLVVYSRFKTLMQGIFTVAVTILMMFLVNWILAIVVILLTPLSMLMAKIVSSFLINTIKNKVLYKLIYHLFLWKHLTILTSCNHLILKMLHWLTLLILTKRQKEGKVANFLASWVNPSTRLVNNIIYVIIGIARHHAFL